MHQLEPISVHLPTSLSPQKANLSPDMAYSSSNEDENNTPRLSLHKQASGNWPFQIPLRNGEAQSLAERRVPGLVNFVPAVAYHFCHNLPAAFTQPGTRLSAKLCASPFLSGI